MIAHHRSAPAGPSDRGEGVGAVHAERIAATLERYRALFAPGTDLDALGAQALAATRGYAPALAAEIAGIAAGARLPAAAVAALNRAPRSSAAAAASARRSRGRAPRCRRGTGTPSWRTAGWCGRSSTPAGASSHTLTEYGIVGKIGVGGALGVHLNILHHARDGGPVGVPVHVVVRHLLDAARDVVPRAPASPPRARPRRPRSRSSAPARR